MRIVLITDEVSADVAEAVGFARAHGIEEIAIRAVSDQAILALDEAAIDALVARVSELGAPVASLLSPLFKAYLPGRSGPALADANIPDYSVDAAVHLAERGRLPALAARLGADCVRVFSFLLEPGATRALPDEGRRLLAELEQSRPGLYAIENEDSCFAGTLEELERCVLESGLRAILDPANDWYLSREPVAPRIGAQLVERIADVHVKDMAGDIVVPLGDGEVDWPAILERLGELGYAGTFTLEPHLERDRDGVARSIEALHQLAGQDPRPSKGKALARRKATP
jgi:sugar phosphate isomerase/epimerase